MGGISHQPTLKKCNKCKLEKPLKHYTKNSLQRDGLCPTCRECYRIYANNYIQRKDREEPGKRWDGVIQARYGISIEQYKALLVEQGGGCALCGSPDPRNRNVQHFCIDHDHQTKEVRGLLCYRCNRGIGLLQDDPEVLAKGVEYLRRPSPIKTLRLVKKEG